ncbi:MAG: MaoC family dehydratase N-terminal domain-containing protein [Chloroflexi bacterium]|nr:MaoC family dehydratase N-terminal domain-containing protein [Chloroflexota bacterium]
MAIPGKITDEGIEDIRKRIGVYYRVDRPTMIASKDVIMHFVNCMGDINPLFLDAAYAAKTRYGCIIAPPVFLLKVAYITGLKVGGLPGVHGFHSGNDFDFVRSIRVNDTITATYRPYDIVKRESAFARTLVIVYAQSYFKNQRDEVVAKGLGWTIRTERGTAKERGKYKELQEKKAYTSEELQAIQDAIEAEEVRGATPRCWEDVKVGDDLQPVVKGPLRMVDIALGGLGSGDVFGAHIFQLLPRMRHPTNVYIDPATGTEQHPHRGHWEDFMAREIGVPGAYDIGTQRISWMGQVFTNWQGDDGFLKKLSGSFRMFNIEGDTQFVKAQVTRKYVQGREYLVDCDVQCVNQRNQITAPGKATVVLPSRDPEAIVPM